MEAYDLLLIAKLKGLSLLPEGEKFETIDEALEDSLQCIHGKKNFFV